MVRGQDQSLHHLFAAKAGRASRLCDRARALRQRCPRRPPDEGPAAHLDQPADAFTLCGIRRTSADVTGIGGIAGVYFGRASGPVSFANSQPKRNRWDLDGRTVFFHEYLHHLMLQDATAAYPTWMVGGLCGILRAGRVPSRRLGRVRRAAALSRRRPSPPAGNVDPGHARRHLSSDHGPGMGVAIQHAAGCWPIIWRSSLHGAAKPPNMST